MARCVSRIQRGDPGECVLYSYPSYRIKMGQVSVSAANIHDALQNCKAVYLHPVTLALKEDSKNSMQS